MFSMMDSIALIDPSSFFLTTITGFMYSKKRMSCVQFSGMPVSENSPSTDKAWIKDFKNFGVSMVSSGWKSDSAKRLMYFASCS